MDSTDKYMIKCTCGECKGWLKEGRKIHACDIARMFGFTENDYCSKGRPVVEKKD